MLPAQHTRVPGSSETRHCLPDVVLRCRHNVRVFGTISSVKTTCPPAPNWRGICGAQHVARRRSDVQNSRPHEIFLLARPVEETRRNSHAYHEDRCPNIAAQGTATHPGSLCRTGYAWQMPALAMPVLAVVCGLSHGGSEAQVPPQAGASGECTPGAGPAVGERRLPGPAHAGEASITHCNLPYPVAVKCRFQSTTYDGSRRT